jgi:hypothetical protein
MNNKLFSAGPPHLAFACSQSQPPRKVPFIIYIVQDAHFTIKLTEVKHNVPLDDSVFVKPTK